MGALWINYKQLFPGGVLGYIFAGHVPLASLSPYPIIVYHGLTNYRPHLSHFKQISNFRHLNLGTFYFYELTHFFKLNEEHFLFSYSTNILLLLLTVDMKNCLTPKYPKMCDPILVTLLKMRPHYSQSSRENATPSSGTSPLASYKKVPPSPSSNYCSN